MMSFFFITRGLEATPIVDNGVMFVTNAWSIVHAIDARTGKELWFYDPDVPRIWSKKACCDVVNRGVAVWKGYQMGLFLIFLKSSFW